MIDYTELLLVLDDGYKGNSHYAKTCGKAAAAIRTLQMHEKEFKDLLVIKIKINTELQEQVKELEVSDRMCNEDHSALAKKYHAVKEQVTELDRANIAHVKLSILGVKASARGATVRESLQAQVTEYEKALKKAIYASSGYAAEIDLARIKTMGEKL